MSGASGTNAVVTVTIGGVNVGEKQLTKNAENYTFEVPEDVVGYDIVITITQSSSKAVYIKSIKVS